MEFTVAKNTFKKFILAVLVFCFTASSFSLRAYARSEQSHLRSTATKKSNRLDDINSKLTLGDSLSGVQKTEKGGNQDGGTTFKDILGEYTVASTDDKFPLYSYVKEIIDVQKTSPQAIQKISEILGEPVNLKDEYATVSYRGLPIAVRKRAVDGTYIIKKVVDDVSGIPMEVLVDNVSTAKARGFKAIDILISDYMFLSERSRKPVAERMTLDYKELRDLVVEIAREKGRKAAQEVGLSLAGGKGLSLSMMDGVVDVPPGFNVTTTAYFHFVRENREVWEKIDRELRTLDTMDDQRRDVVSREIREIIRLSPIPENIKKEVLVMYRQLNIIRYLAKKPTPTAIAVRSSGIKEDIHVKSWLPTTTGSQAGQSDTFLNVKGEEAVLDKLRADWASLFTDRAVSYRDDAVFLIFSSLIQYKDKEPRQVYYDMAAKFREYSAKLNKPELANIAHMLTSLRNPGSANLVSALEEVLKHENNPELQFVLDKLKIAADDFVHPEKIGIDVVDMQMAKSYVAGVLFTVNPATKMAGVAQAVNNAWYLNDRSLVYEDEKGTILGTKPTVVSFEVSFGYGENVVGGKVDPDKFVMGTYDGKKWFILEKHKGTKLIQMIDVEEAIEALEEKLPEDRIRSLSGMVANAVSYDEVGKRINGILVRYLFGTRYLRELPDKKDESDKDKKARVQQIANDISDKIKNRETRAAINAYIRQNFVIAGKQDQFGIKEEALDQLINSVFEAVDKARQERDRGMRDLTKFFGKSVMADNFIFMLKEVWENKEFMLPERLAVHQKLNLDTVEVSNLSYLLRSLIDNSFTANYLTTEAHQDIFSINQEVAQSVARMAWAITTYYRDQRDIEFAIEIDPSAPEAKRLQLYAIDRDGNVLEMDETGKIKPSQAKLNKEGNVSMRLYNVQARPYTSEFLKVDVKRQRTEVDEDFIEANSLRPIATGTMGENSSHAYVLVFDPNKTIAQHADQINRMKRGEFTEEEWAQIEALGMNPAEFNADNPLPIALYLLEADPNHDPIMRLVDAVITIRGGDTCHAAIFCREQGIPAVTAVGKVLLEGRLLKTGDGLTVDANNGKLYKLEADPKKRIPLFFVKFRIKPYGIPEDDDGMAYPTIGQIIAAGSAAQQNSPIMLAPDAAGNSLTRAEFKGEELGLNVFAGYGYDLIQDINSGKSKMPVKVRVADVIAGKVANSDAFSMSAGKEIYQYLQKNPAAAAAFKNVFGRRPGVKDGMMLLTAFDEEGSDISRQRAQSFLKQLDSADQGFFNYEYGKFQRRFNYDYNIITALQSHPWILDEITDKLKEKGYSSFKEYVGEEFYEFYNLMGFTISPDQKAKNRAYDFAQDKVRGMPGSEVFSWPGVNPLVGLRGAALEIEGVDQDFEGNQKVLDFLLDSVIEANENTHNQAWFYVFVRFARELDTLDMVLERIAKKNGRLPKQIGIMIEVPSDAILMEQFAKKLSAMKTKYAPYGVQSVFISFGTNDYSHLAGMGDREDPRMKLDIQSPSAQKAIAEMKQAGFFYDDSKKKLPLIDEGADPVVQLIEAVVKVSKDYGIETSLCGEAITALVNRGDYDTAGKIMALLDSFGISMMKVRLAASMTRYDTMAATKEITVPETRRKVVFDLSSATVNQKVGVIKGPVIYVDSAQDLIPDSLKGLEGEDLKKERENMKLQSKQSAQSTMRTHNSIVVVTRNLVAQSGQELETAMGVALIEQFVKEGLLKDIGSGLYVWTNLTLKAKDFEAELKNRQFSEQERQAILSVWKQAWNNTIAGLEERGIDWDDLQYAKAIIVDASVNLEGWDVFRKDKGIVPSRVKAVAAGIAGLRQELEGSTVTIDYGAKKVYDGNLAVRKKEGKIRSLTVPKADPSVPSTSAAAIDANNAYPGFVYHPLILLAYENGALEQYEKIFDEYAEKLVEEVKKIAQEKNAQKRSWMLEEFRQDMASVKEPMIKEFIEGLLADVSQGKEPVLGESWLVWLRNKYFAQLSSGITKLLEGKSAQQFIIDGFKAQIERSLSDNPDMLNVYLTSSLPWTGLNDMYGGFLVEQGNPNPYYGLRAAARALGDMWKIEELGLAAFKEVRAALPAEQRKDLGLQITDVQGTQAGAVMIGWKYILRDQGLIPGEDGLAIGVNIVSPSNALAAEKYFEYFRDLGKGLNFVSFGEQKKAGAAWSGVDIYWNEWRRLGQDKELQQLGEDASKIVKAKIAEINSKLPAAEQKQVVTFVGSEKKAAPKVQMDGGVMAQLVATARSVDEEAFVSTSYGYNSFLQALKSADLANSGLVVGGNTLLQNAGALSALSELNEENPSLRIVVWATNEEQLQALLSLGVHKVAQLTVGARSALGVMDAAGITREKTAMINSDLDLAALEDAYGVHQAADFFAQEPKLVSVFVQTARTGEAQKWINNMSLVFARAVAALAAQDRTAADSFASMVQEQKQAGLISDSEAANLVNDLSNKLVEMPLARVTDAVAAAQITFEDTVNKI